MSTTVSGRRDTYSLGYAIRSGLAGGIAGCVEKTAVAPLEKVRILFQTSNLDSQKHASSCGLNFTFVAFFQVIILPPRDRVSDVPTAQ
ncbi:hypothetical protein EDD15DRAFT_2288631 [Pisolithus albus]|nr:hypothetical protein EDD15DRAFT_2288631 [Pisolithus albus]